MSRIHRVLTIATALIGLAACAGPGGGGGVKPSLAPEEATKARAQERWNLLISGKFADAWEYLTPGYRSTSPKEIWAANMEGRPVKWLKAAATEAICPANESYCDVTVVVDYEATMPIQGVGKVQAASPVAERWLLADGQWYFLPKDVAQTP